MEAPDKIYVSESLIKTPYGNEWSPTPYVSRENTEYIRKGILMEWAEEGKEHYKKLMEDFPDEISFAASFGAYNAFIEKLNSLESPAGMHKTE